MEFRGNIGTPVEEKTSANGRTYFRFRVAENMGKKDDPNRKTRWWDVQYFPKDEDLQTGQLLGTGLYVHIIGWLEDMKIYHSNKENKDMVSLLVQTSRIEIVPGRNDAEGEQGGNRAGQGASAPSGQQRNGAGTSAAPALPPEFDDDIPF
jgi:single-stranded DNA-binding protein